MLFEYWRRCCANIFQTHVSPSQWLVWVICWEAICHGKYDYRTNMEQSRESGKTPALDATSNGNVAGKLSWWKDTVDRWDMAALV